MEKLTDSEIIQEATEAVTKGYPCAFYVPQLLEVIKNKEAEIFNLNKEISALKLKNDEFLKSNEKAKAEIERVKKSRDDLYEEMSERQKEEVKIARKMGKSEAYREFAERVEKLIISLLTSATMEKKEVIHFCLNIIQNELEELTSPTTPKTANHSASLIDGHIEG